MGAIGRAGPRLLAAALTAAAVAGSGQALAQAPATGDTAQAAIAALNAQREANGIPADLIEDADYSLGCRMHLAYEALNGRSPTDPHSEDPVKAGFTELGRTAAQSSVLGNPAIGWSAGNPWERAPIHLMETLSPALARTGWAPGCMWARPVVPRPAPASIRVYTYPGTGASIYPSERAEDEWPFVPGDFVGLPMGSVTGPHIMVMPFGPAQAGTGPPRPTRILSARLTGADGPVEVRTVDEATTGPHGDLGSYLDGGMVIPAEPLQPGADYRAHVSLLVAGEEAVDYSWTFRTAGPGVEPFGDSGRRPRVRIGSVLRAGEEVRVTVLGAEAAGRRARIITQPLGRTCRPAGRQGPARRVCRIGPVRRARVLTVRLRPSQEIALSRLRHGHRIVVTTPAFTATGARYERVRLVRVIR
jgi:hypothetical protein